ncbi:UNKNOWN [Stylonychia lemnae]|uniref:Uncharacterized protein n=1 Tax=Stylonychia lemnae TaxID=5949 RepID=A0A078AM87_STYLE|nr:UNKNOWN [Stylonychia lemnae]|eukprot:CDW83011.1 UNKNOWN [Stylonychia lemnae]
MHQDTILQKLEVQLILQPLTNKVQHQIQLDQQNRNQRSSEDFHSENQIKPMSLRKNYQQMTQSNKIIPKKCFGVEQLPLLFGVDRNVNSKVNVVNYDFTNDYLYFGGQYGSIPMIGFFDNQQGFERLLWLHSYQINGQLYQGLQISEIESLMNRNNKIYAAARSIDEQPSINTYHYLFILDLQGRYPKGIQIQGQFSQVILIHTTDFGKNNTVLFATQNYEQRACLYIISDDLSIVLTKLSFQEQNTRIGFIVLIPLTNTLFISGVNSASTNYGLFFHQIDLDNQQNQYKVPTFNIASKSGYSLIVSIFEYIDQTIIGCLQRR